MRTSIEWTDETWSPVRGCALVSAGCANCYAMKQAHRFSGKGQAYEGLTELGPQGPRWNGTIRLVPEVLDAPLRWKKPRRIFVNSMSDLFHEDVPDEFIVNVYAVMVAASWHTFQVLTKRPERRRYLLNAPSFREWVAQRAAKLINALRGDRSLSATENLAKWNAGQAVNIHEGVSVEDQKTADERIPILLQTPAAVRFVSAEPLLWPVDCSTYLQLPKTFEGMMTPRQAWNVLLDWVIVGGESGPGARPMHPAWVRSLRDQCQAAGVPFFFKQWGEWTPGENVRRRTGVAKTASWFNSAWNIGSERLSSNDVHRDDEPDLYRVGKKAAGAMLDGRMWREMPK